MSKSFKPQSNRKRLTLTLFVLILFGIGGAWVYRIARSLAGKNGNIGDVLVGIRDPRGKFPGKSRIIILLAGKDYNHNAQDIAYTTSSRSDTIMLLSADLEHAKLTAVGIPRDTRVTAPDGVTGKINATFQRGGIKLLASTITQQFGIVPDYSVVLKADAVKSIVNSLGGIEVDVLDRMFYEDSWDDLKIDLQPGRYRVNGEQAVGFVRFRKSGTHRYGPRKEKIPVPYVPSKEEGDLRRIERQQQVVHAMLAEVTKPQNIVRWNEILDVAFGQIETNLSRPQMLGLATILRSSAGSPLGGSSIPGKDANIGGTYYWKADIPRAKATLQWLLLGDEAAGRSLVRVSIMCDKAEQVPAQALSDELEKSGFAVTTTTTRKVMPLQTTVIYHTATFEAFAKSIAASSGNMPIRKEPIDSRMYWVPEIRVEFGHR
jgi:polyisoprenyl-teichoic acid--peptidoglycan teichoic acid transferase